MSDLILRLPTLHLFCSFVQRTFVFWIKRRCLHPESFSLYEMKQCLTLSSSSPHLNFVGFLSINFSCFESKPDVLTSKALHRQKKSTSNPAQDHKPFPKRATQRLHPLLSLIRKRKHFRQSSFCSSWVYNAVPKAYASCNIYVSGVFSFHRSFTQDPHRIKSTWKEAPSRKGDHLCTCTQW